MDVKSRIVLRRLSFIFLLNSLSIFAFGQTYSFENRDASSYPEVLPYNDGVYCLFKASDKKAPVTVFKQVFLNSDLNPTDSSSYTVDGNAKLIGSCSDERTTTHAFYSKTGSIEKIVFIITDQSGRVLSTFFKTAADLTGYLAKPVKKLKNIQFSFIANNGSPGMLLIQPYQTSGSISHAGRIFALNAADGSQLWVSNAPQLSNIQTTGSLLIGLSTTVSSSGFSSSYLRQIHFVDKESGKLIKSVQFTSKGKGYRDISVFATNGIDLMIAGSEFESTNNKNGRFYMTMYNLSGEKIFDNVDSAARLSTRRMHLMGSTFDQDGNLVLIGEGWKPDATRAIATTAGSILAASLIGGYASVYTRVDHKIDHVIFATLSPTDGSLKNFKSFPVGPWLNYGRLMTEGSHALLVVSSQAIMYDVNESNAAPSLLTTLRLNESLILTPSGPIINKREKGRYTLRRLH